RRDSRMTYWWTSAQRRAHVYRQRSRLAIEEFESRTLLSSGGVHAALSPVPPETHGKSAAASATIQPVADPAPITVVAESLVASPAIDESQQPAADPGPSPADHGHQSAAVDPAAPPPGNSQEAAGDPGTPATGKLPKSADAT